ncbi:MAG TPA: helix-turn-helix domain-containing protein [Candidatus Companilactobacillus pullicola]|uniref:Helix-turn-helix domain-containing protein n=1 Tax=Candidatus Companilactobacillus pullicola TaxID=2838523 RepID=A0A9D1ZLP4_9LACO|nr:helix-turn-helix domain-containing protein [Candidatus Companilactobacillus pullicola]
MPIEEALEETKKEVERKIKFALLDRGMTQKQLSDLIKENRQQVNSAIKGDTTPKSKEIRNKIYQLFNIKGMK